MDRWILPPWARTLLWRHLFGRHARPAVRWMNRFAFLGVSVAVFSWVSVVSIMDGLQGEIRGNILNERAHLLWEAGPRAGLESLLPKFRSALGSDLKSIRFLLQTEGLLEVVGSRQKGRIVGSGVLLQGVEGMGAGVSASQDLYDLLGLALGDEVRLRSAWKLEGAPLSEKIVSVVESGGSDIDRSSIKIDRAVLNQWLGLGDAVSRIEIQLKDPDRADDYVGTIEEATGLRFKTWKQVNASLWYSLRIEKLLMTVIVAFVVVLAALSVHLALAVRVAEKSREIGLLKGLGASPRDLTHLFFWEGITVGVGGALIGLLLSRVFCILISKYVQLPDFYYAASIPVEWKWGTAGMLALCAIGATALASWGPASRVSRALPADALRS